MHLQFSDAIAHRRIDPDEYEETYVVGDVHGCLDSLERLLSKLDATEETLVVFVGDLVRKGPDSKGVVDLIRSRENLVPVRGNNEQKFLTGDASLPELGDEDLSYLTSLPVALSWADGVVVHGGIDPRKPLADHTTEELLTMRSLADAGGYDRPLWFEQTHDLPRVFFGHTPLARPFVTPDAVGLDTGCVYGGQLTAFDCQRERFVAVEPPRTYQHRPDDKFITPKVPIASQR
jgi:serine/threonine protein phosphatase 1